VRLDAVKRTYAAYERSIRHVVQRHNLQRPAVVTANPLFAGFADFDWAGPVTFFCRDDWSAFEPYQRWWPAYGEAVTGMRRRHRRVVAVSETILDRIAPTGRHAVVPNGIDPDEWRHLPPPPPWFATRPSPRLLYVGSLQSRIDVQQLLELATAFPGGSLTLVGPLLDAGHFAPLQDVPNITFHPPVPRAQIPGLIAHADVGLIPHVRSPLTEGMCPLKLYEYLAAGIPVVAVDLPAIAGVSNRVVLVPPSQEMVGAAHRALTLGPASDAERLAFVTESSWERRFDALLDVALAPADDSGEPSARPLFL
jgi:glycosyltransferase involved in cell wall biosynthesis